MMISIIGHRNFHPKSINNGLLWQWPLDYLKLVGDLENLKDVHFCLLGLIYRWKNPWKLHLLVKAFDNIISRGAYMSDAICVLNMV